MMTLDPFLVDLTFFVLTATGGALTWICGALVMGAFVDGAVAVAQVVKR